MGTIKEKARHPPDN
ncbi:hypothetical protein C351_03888 [Cryptococcus neoformans c8]|nr:hypothetical protein C351_03888 [Cryptococcus neoformans var. grubii c8]